MKWIWHLCWANMKQRGIRTFLTILGVVIGIVSVSYTHLTLPTNSRV